MTATAPRTRIVESLNATTIFGVGKVALRGGGETFRDGSSRRRSNGSIGTKKKDRLVRYMNVFLVYIENIKNRRVFFLHTVMILPQVHLRKPCYDFYFL